MVLASTYLLTGCNKEKPMSNQNTLHIENLDTTVSPGTDFYQYATGGWQKLNPIPDDQSRFGTFDQLAENNQEQIKELIIQLAETHHEDGSVAQKIGTLYAMGMDSAKLNHDGAAPIKPQLHAIEQASNLDDIIQLIGTIHQNTSSPYFGIYVGADEKNSDRNILQLYQSGLQLPSRDYYLHTDSHSIQIREAYKKLIETQFVNAGYTPRQGAQAAQNVLQIETALAKVHFEKEKTRIPELNYHLINTKQLNEKVTPFNWELLFQSLKITPPQEINIAQIEPISQTFTIIKNTPIEQQKDYLRWLTINASSDFLSDDFVTEKFNFFGQELAGIKTIRPRWKRVVTTVNNVLGEEVGQIYISKYFPKEAKERMTKLVDNLKSTLAERINNLEWMSNVTKEKAHEKLSGFIIKIGYPNKWRDCSQLQIQEDSYWNNILRSRQFEYNQNIDKLQKPVDKDQWYMSPQTVNAYYNPTTNEICFPAGILQPPFFYLNGDDAINYGAIGVVIGHEMTHGFDDQGRKYDKNGNMTDWWTASDAEKFTQRAQKMVDFFNAIEVAPGVHANGQFTLGENIADHGGLQIAFAAFSKTPEYKTNQPINGFTPAQRFFLSYANVWAGNIRETEILRRTKTDPHSLGKWRVNGALPHIQAWYDAFNITAEDSLYLPQAERVSIW